MAGDALSTSICCADRTPFPGDLLANHSRSTGGILGVPQRPRMGKFG